MSDLADHLGPYRLLGELGRGGMGIVHRAQDAEGRTVAIKELVADPTLPEGVLRDTLERFRREALAASRLSHPNIVSVLDHGVEGDRHYMVMELLEGQSLGAMLEEGRRFSYEDVVAIGTQICEALDYAHQAGVIHRDIKPDNVMVDDAGRLKLMDFGVARIRSDLPAMTTTGTTLGTIAYISPEQLTDSRQVDGRTDLFSLGALLYELLTQRTPFDAGSLGGTIMKIMNEPPEPLRSYDAQVPEALATVVLRALRKNPEDRYRRAAEMASALRLALQGSEVALASSVAIAPPCRFCGAAMGPDVRVCPSCGKSAFAPMSLSVPAAQPVAPAAAPQAPSGATGPLGAAGATLRGPGSGPLVWKGPGTGPLAGTGPLGRPASSRQVVIVTLLAIFGGPGHGDGEFQQPRDLALDGQHHVWVADTENGRLQVFDPRGVYVRQIRPPNGQEAFRFPRALAFGPGGVLYVVDDLDFRITRIDPGGKFLPIWKRQRPGEPKPPIPARIVATHKGHLYVSEPNAHRVTAYADERPYAVLSGPELVAPGALALNPAGDLVVVDGQTGRAYVNERRDGLRYLFGSKGDGPGEFNFPRGLFIDRFGYAFVADTLNHRIQVFDPQGKVALAFGRKGSRPGEFAGPESLAVSADNRLYVVDRGNHRIQVFGLERG